MSSIFYHVKSRAWFQPLVHMEVFISYIETAGSTMTRQRTLEQQYFFTCSCPRCSKMGKRYDIQESAILEGYSCVDDECNGFLLRDSGDQGFVCQRCGRLRSKEELKKFSSRDKSNLIQTREKLLKMLMEVEDWREALSYCKLTIHVYQLLYLGKTRVHFHYSLLQIN
ncbi:Histone-lysine N-methyltransferase ASHR1 [Euphorbia peplus]|nr:Histone-lysine N-methyltransferase ASHR1 [Euphorbia peplus]